MEQKSTDFKKLKFFTRWLKENGAYAAYCNAFKDPKAINKHVLMRDTNLKHLLAKMRSKKWKYIITLSFVWSRTPQGDDFWSELHIKFQEYYDKNFKAYEGKNS